MKDDLIFFFIGVLFLIGMRNSLSGLLTRRLAFEALQWNQINIFFGTVTRRALFVGLTLAFMEFSFHQGNEEGITATIQCYKTV